MTGIDTQLIIPLLAIAAGTLNTTIMGALRKLSVTVDTLGPQAKQAVVIILAFGVSKLSTLIGLPLPADPTTWSGDVVNSVLIGLISFGVHNVKKSLPVLGQK